MPRLYPFATDSFQAIELHASASFSAGGSTGGSTSGSTSGSIGGSTGGLALSFSLVGDSAALANFLLPQPASRDAAGERRNHLWQSTCWECFVAMAGVPGYFEINLSPAHHWNVYHFTGYRQGMTTVPLPPPSFHSRRQDDCYQLDALIAGLPLTGVSANLSNLGNWRLGLAAVLAGTDGGKGYFALAHPRAQPDFHHADGFVFRLNPWGMTDKNKACRKEEGGAMFRHGEE